MPVAFPFIIAGIALFYYLVNPFLSDYPLRCVWHAATNTQCPACGMQRALHLLVHGNVSEALSCNYFFVISIPFALIAVLAEWYNYNHTLDPLRRFIYHRYTLWAYVVAYFGWWILRNVLSV